MLNGSSIRWSAVALVALLAACGDDGGGTTIGPEDEQPDRCQDSDECDDGRVCRGNVCVIAPDCERNADCESGESCADGFCQYDAEICQQDDDCDLEGGEICEAAECRVGCRSDGACPDDEECSDDFECVLRSCTEIGCRDGFDCIDASGECQLRPCNGGCDEPLSCREEDDTCVECFRDNECGEAQFCAPDGFCANDSCFEHDECPDDFYCIDEFCSLPPDCDEDDLEPNDFWGSGTILAEGEHVNFVSCPFNDDFHQVVADGGRSLTVEVLFDHDDGNIDLELLNPVGVTFARGNSETDNEMMTVNTFKTGIYAIRVFQPEGGRQGVSYSLRLSTGPEVEVAPDECIIDGFEDNDTPEEATPIFVGRWTGPTVCAADHDYYLLPALPGELYRVCLTPSPLFGVPLGLEVLDSDGVAILADAGQASFCVEEDLLFGDDFVTHVFGLTDEAESAYHIEFFVDTGCRLFDDIYDENGQNNRVPRDDDPPLEVLPPDTPTELRVCPNNPDYWPVDLLRRDQLTATIDFVHADGDLQMRLLRPSGTVIISSTGTGDQEAINYQAELDGTHYIRVYGEGEDDGAYTFSYSVTPWCVEDGLEDNDERGSAATVALDTTDSLWRCAADDDWYTVQIPNGTNATSLTIGISYAAGDGTLELEVFPPGAEEGIAGTVAPGTREVVLSEDLVEELPYDIRVHGADTAQNTYALTVTAGTE